MEEIAFNIGEIDLTQILSQNVLNEFLKINLSDKMNKCNVRVLGREGLIPHFHIETQNQNPILICYVCIFKSAYFIHKNRKNTTLENDQCKYLDHWLREIDPKKSPKFTRWELIAYRWKDAGNPLTNWIDPTTIIQPDYRNISFFINEK